MKRKVYKDPACVGCKHYVGTSSVYMCNYWEDENRLRPCLPGKYCTVKTTGRLRAHTRAKRAHEESLHGKSVI